MKTVVKILLLLGVVAYFIFATIQVKNKSVEDVTCTNVEVLFQDSTEDNFLQGSYIHNLLAQHKISPEGQKINQINLTEIEKVLADCPYVSQANCYYTAEGKLCIEVEPLKPILHVIADNGEEYYLDRKGVCMPVGNFNLNLCLATGHITKESATKNLTSLATFIHDNEFWSKQIEQLYVDRHNIVSLYTCIGDQTIVLGDTQNYVDKFDRLMLFYEKGFPKVGWNKYKTINLAFEGQIVCAKSDK